MGQVKSQIIMVIAVVAAVIYNSWPLGFALNPSVARAGLASDLEAYGEPYAWLFVGGDVLSGILIVGAVLYLFRGRVLRSLQADLLSLGLIFFGLMTVMSALLPLRCGTDILTCGYHVGQTFGAHDVIAGLAAIGLFIAMVASWRASRRNTKLAWLNWFVLITWSFWGLTFLLTPLPFVQHMPNLQVLAITWQQVFLIVSGIGIVLSMKSLESLSDEQGGKG